jgi:5-methylthioadenosine/S-adenosylhomocysteine deaminase
MAPGFLGKGELYQLDGAMGHATFNEACRLCDEFHGADEGRIQCLFGPFAPDFVSRKWLVRAKEEAARRGIPIQMHTAQGSRETHQMELRYRQRSIAYLEEHDYFDPDFTAVHMTDATHDEVHQVAEAGSHLVVCNGSIGLVDGMIPPAALFQKAGGCVGLGSDQAAGNNCCNIFNEMKLTALFGKIAARDPTAMPADKVLRMATIDGAKTLGLQNEIGSLTPGKRADMIFVDTRRPTMLPVITEPFNLVANLVYAARGDEVDRVMIDGKFVYEGGEFRTIDAIGVQKEIHACVPRTRRKISF